MLSTDNCFLLSFYFSIFVVQSTYIFIIPQFKQIIHRAHTKFSSTISIQFFSLEDIWTELTKISSPCPMFKLMTKVHPSLISSNEINNKDFKIKFSFSFTFYLSLIFGLFHVPTMVNPGPISTIAVSIRIFIFYFIFH